MSEQNTRVVAYDMLRVLAAVAVVTIHVLAAGVVGRGNAGYTAPWIYSSYTFIWFATPAFAFLTGALLWNYRRIGTWPDLWMFVRRRATIVLWPYLLWSAFYLWYARYTPSHLRPEMPIGDYLVDVGRLLVLGKASSHLYFLPVVLLFYLVAPVVSRAFAWRPWVAFALLWSVGAFATILIPAAPSDHLVTVYGLFHLTMWLLPAAAFGGLYGAIRVRHAWLLGRIWPFLLAAGLFLRWYDRGPLQIENVWAQRALEYSYLGAMLFGLVCMMEALSRKLPSIEAPARWLGAGAMGVYLIHPVAIGTLSDAVVRFGLESLWTKPAFTIVVTTLVVGGCFAGVMLVVRNPSIAWVFSVSGKRKRILETEPVFGPRIPKPLLPEEPLVADPAIGSATGRP